MILTEDLARLGAQTQGRQIREVLGVHAHMEERSRRQRLPENDVVVGVDIVDELPRILLVKQVYSHRVRQGRLEGTGVVLHRVAVEILERISNLDLVQLTEENRIHPAESGEPGSVAIEPEGEQLAIGEVVGKEAVDSIILQSSVVDRGVVRQRDVAIASTGRKVVRGVAVRGTQIEGPLLLPALNVALGPETIAGVLVPKSQGAGRPTAVSISG